MSKSDVDKGFELLIVIIGLTFSIMGSKPEFFWGDTPEISLELTSMRSTIIPLLMLTGLWLIGILMKSENRKIYAKLVAWIAAFSMAMNNVLVYFIGVKFWSGFGEMDPYVFIPLLFIISPALVFIFIAPKYREMYPDATFFKNNTGQRIVFTYVLYFVVILCLIILTSTEYHV